jgi:hypothetical protein
MRIEKVIKREDGSKVRITATINQTYNKLTYETWVHVCGKGKRSWVGVYSTDDFSFRRLDSKGREAFVESKQLLHVTKLELYQARLELWESIKPQESA